MKTFEATEFNLKTGKYTGTVETYTAETFEEFTGKVKFYREIHGGASWILGPSKRLLHTMHGETCWYLGKDAGMTRIDAPAAF